MSTRKSKAASNLQGESWPPASVLDPGPYHKWTRAVVFDFHEVCAKWLKRYCHFYNMLHGTNLQPEDFDFYNMQFKPSRDPSKQVMPELFDKTFVMFARASTGGYGDLEAHEGIKEAMEQIQAAGIKILIWSWTPAAADIKPDGAGAYNTGIAQDVTKRLIRKLQLPVDVDRDVDFMPPSRKKWEMVEEHIPLIVEDNKTTASDVADAAHAVLLVPEKYNEGFQCRNVLRLSNRSELAATVIDFYQKLDEAGVLL